jgi:hypothetical protein
MIVTQPNRFGSTLLPLRPELGLLLRLARS